MFSGGGEPPGELGRSLTCPQWCEPPPTPPNAVAGTPQIFNRPLSKVLPHWVAGSPLLWCGLSWCTPTPGDSPALHCLASGNAHSLPPGEIFFLNSLQILFLVHFSLVCLPWCMLPMLEISNSSRVGGCSSAVICSFSLGAVRPFSLSLMFLGFTVMCLGVEFFFLAMSSSALCESIYNEIFPLILANSWPLFLQIFLLPHSFSVVFLRIQLYIC